MPRWFITLRLTSIEKPTTDDIEETLNQIIDFKNIKVYLIEESVIHD